MSTENSVINGREADLLLYGEIVNNAVGGEDVVLGKAVVGEILTLSQSCDRIRVHINSEGGEVYAGIAIFNALRSCTREVTIYTDGISASIAGIIAMCGRKHYMSKYARLMIHSVSAGVYGDKNDLLATVDEIKSLEDTLAVIIGERMKCSPDEVKTRYFDGTDHWFSAEEAVRLGLADGIYDIDVDLRATDGPNDIYKKVFTNRAAIRSQIVNNMDITKIKEKPRFTNVVNEDDVLRVIDELNAQIEKLEGENSSLKQRLSEMEQEDIEKILSAAVECGKIEEGEKEDYRQLLNSNRASAEKVIASLKPKRRVRDDIRGAHQPENSGAGAWDTKMDEIRRNRSRR